MFRVILDLGVISDLEVDDANLDDANLHDANWLFALGRRHFEDAGSLRGAGTTRS